MPNRNYQKGARREYQVIKILLEEGYNGVSCVEAQRTAGSHGVFDVVAIMETGAVYLIQVKSDTADDELWKLEALPVQPPNKKLQFHFHFRMGYEVKEVK